MLGIAYFLFDADDIVIAMATTPCYNVNNQITN